MDLNILFSNPYSTALVAISLGLIAFALFSKRIRNLSDEQGKKINKPGSYIANQKDIFSSYCPKCNSKLNLSTLKLKKCQICNVKIASNKSFLILLFGGIALLLISLVIENKFPDYGVTSLSLKVASIFILLISFTKNRYISNESK